MSNNYEKEVLKAYEQYLAYFLDNDMDGINSLVKFPITYIADGESKSLNAFPVTPKEMMENKQWDTTIDTCLLYTSPSPRDRQKSRMPSSA